MIVVSIAFFETTSNKAKDCLVKITGLCTVIMGELQSLFCFFLLVHSDLEKSEEHPVDLVAAYQGSQLRQENHKSLDSIRSYSSSATVDTVVYPSYATNFLWQVSSSLGGFVKKIGRAMPHPL